MYKIVHKRQVFERERFMKSKILSLSLALCLLLVMFPLVLGASALAPAADGKVYLTGAADLKALMGDSTLWGKDIVLQNDIDMTGETGQTPIGNATTAFKGTFIGVKKADGSNPEIKGLDIKTTAATNRWGLIGYATGNVTVKNITVRGEISTAGGGVAGIVGAMVGGNLVIEDCVNYCTVTSTNADASRAGGILGIAQNAGVSVRNCVNYGAISGVVHAGGVVGRFETTANKTGFTMEIVDCINNGAVSSSGAADKYKQDNGVGGIIGSAVDRGGITMTISRCLNTGDVNGKTCVGGILGQPANISTPNLSTGAHVIKVADCMNTGDITASGTYAGGIVSYLKDTKYIIYVDRVYNTGAVSATNYGLAVFGVPRGSVIKNAYYSNGPTDTKATSVTPASTFAENKELFPGLASSEAWTVTNAGPVLASTHEHDFVDGACTTCGEKDACKHTGSLIWEKSAEGTYSLVCRNCNETLLPAQSELPTVYLNNTGSDANLGTATAPVLTLEEAVRRLTETGGSVFLQNRYTITKSIVLPEWEGKITFCSTTDADGNANNGFYFGFTSTIDTYNRFVDENVCLSLGGDAEFNNIVFKGNSPYKSEDSQGKDTVLGIAANWHNVDFTYIRFHDRARVFFVEGTRLSTESNTEVKDVTVNFYGPAVSTGNPDGFVPFFHIVLGDWYGTGEAIDCSNKTVTLNMRIGKFGSGAAELVYTMSTHDYVGRKAGTSSNCATTINLYDASVIQKLRTGYRNTEEAGSTASLDSLTLNFNDNSAISQVALLRNVKNTVVNISDKANGRTKPMSGYFDFRAHGAFANETEPATVTATYGSHSFAAGVATPFDTETNGQGRYTLNATTSVDCSDWTYANANGTYTRTCPTCGRTETVVSLAFGSTTATSTGSTVRFIAEMTLGKGAAVEKYGMLITALADQTADSGSFADDRFAFAEGTDVTAAVDGKLRFAADLTGIPAGKGDTPIYAWAYVKLAGLDDLVVLPFDAVTANGLKK